MAEQTQRGTVEDRITRLVLEYAQVVPEERPLRPGLSLRQDLEIESLSLVSVVISLGEEFDADLAELGMDLSGLKTIGDLMALGQKLMRSQGQQANRVAGPAQAVNNP